MDTTITKNKKIACLSVIIVCSLLWLGYQVLLYNSAIQFLVYSRKAVALLGIPAMNRDLEWRRFCSALAYLQTLPHVLLAYCLFQKWPGKKNAVRVLLVLLVFACSLIAIPRISVRLFHSYQNILSSNNPNYPHVLLIHGLVGLCATAAAFLGDSATTLLPQNRPANPSGVIKTRAIQYGITFVITLLVLLCSSCILAILSHFNSSAVKSHSSSFAYDHKLLSGIFVTCVMAPLVEELAFRGLILNKVKKYSTVWVGVIFSSILFGLWHRNLAQFLYTTAMGIIFAWIYLKTGKLRFAMFSHFLNNLASNLSATTKSSYLPAVPLLNKIGTFVTEMPLPVVIIELLLLWGLIILLIAKGYPRRPEENA